MRSVLHTLPCLGVALAPVSVSAQGFASLQSGGIQRVVVPPAADAKELQHRISVLEARIAALERRQAFQPPAADGQRKSALPAPPLKQDVAQLPVAAAAGTAASGLGSGGLAFGPMLGLLGLAGIGAAAALSGGGTTATVSTR